jgi:Zn-dependent protease
MVLRAAGQRLSGTAVSRPYVAGRLGGVPIRVHPSLTLTCLVVALVAGRLSAALVAPDLRAQAALFGLVAALLYGVSILLHELAHLAALRRHGVPVEHVTLSVWGGITRAARPPDTPVADFHAAAAGPACSGALALAGAGFACALAHTGAHLLCAACVLLAAINLITLVPSIVPVWPADGGYMVRAIAWQLSGSPSTATRFACYQSMALIGVLLLAGVSSLAHPFLPGGAATGAGLLVAALVVSPNVRATVATLRRFRPAEAAGRNG